MVTVVSNAEVAARAEETDECLERLSSREPRTRRAGLWALDARPRQLGARALTMRLAGRRQADVTTAGAAVLGRSLAAGEVAAPGLWLPEQVILPERFFRELDSWAGGPSSRLLPRRPGIELNSTCAQ